MAYLYIKSLHLIFVITWFAGLFYVVRLFIYHTEAFQRNEPEKTILSDQLSLMTKRLWYIISWPSALLAVSFGTTLIILQPGWLKEPFMHIKLGFVFVLILYHLACHKIFKLLQKGVVKYTSMQLRIFNEVSTLLLFAIIFLIVLRNEVDWIWGIVGLISFAGILMTGIKVYKKIRNV